MRTNPIDRWTEPGSLEQITNWAAKGCTMAELAKNMGIARSTLYGWAERRVEIAGAIRDGRMLSVECVENALFRLATGQVVEESTTTEERPDGSTLTRTVTTHKAPNVTACIFFLKNRAGYRDNPQEAQGDDGARERFLAEWRDGSVVVDPLSDALMRRAEKLDSFSREIDAFNEGASEPDR